jgi:uncharacterized protein (TIGR03437 family)
VLSMAITGGTGAFLGARGQAGIARVDAAREEGPASATQDPITRRQDRGGRQVNVLHVIPMSEPAFLSDANSIPRVFHSDLSPVTASSPARSGEILVGQVTGLGPTATARNPGMAFGMNPLEPVTSPIMVEVNGTAVEVFNAIGWPGTIDAYRIDFRVPDVTSAQAEVRITAAWLSGRSIRIPVSPK